MTERDAFWIVVGSIAVMIGAGFMTGIGAMILTSQVIEILRRKDAE